MSLIGWIGIDTELFVIDSILILEKSYLPISQNSLINRSHLRYNAGECVI